MLYSELDGLLTALAAYHSSPDLLDESARWRLSLPRAMGKPKALQWLVRNWCSCGPLSRMEPVRGDKLGGSNMASGTQGSPNVRDQRAGQSGSEGIYEQASEAVSNVADRASEMWDDAYDQGARYYRDVGGSTIGGVIIAGAVGYALAWLVHGNQSYSGRGRATSYREYGRGRNRRDYR